MLHAQQGVLRAQVCARDATDMRARQHRRVCDTAQVSVRGSQHMCTRQHACRQHVCKTACVEDCLRVRGHTSAGRRDRDRGARSRDTRTRHMTGERGSHGHAHERVRTCMKRGSETQEGETVRSTARQREARGHEPTRLAKGRTTPTAAQACARGGRTCVRIVQP